jgi:preprotein translocase subunit SecF
MADENTTVTASATGEETGNGHREGVFTRLYTGTGAFDVVGTRKRWYIALGIIALIFLSSITFKGFNYGIDFVGGTTLQMPATGANGPITPERVKAVFHEALPDVPEPTVQAVGAGTNQSIVVKSPSLSPTDVFKVKGELTDKLAPTSGGNPAQVSDSAVSGSWGGEVTNQALIALLVFLVLVTLFLAFYFEKWMALAALASLLFDLLVTSGVYSMVGFEVTPATVIGLLTILGFSLYDTVVVFGRVKENTRGLLGLTRRTYGEAANLALNQTLMRSINTSLIAILPVLGLLVVGAGLLGVGTLKDLALVQLVGMVVGAFSSIVLATPLLVDLKMTEAPYRQQAARVLTRRESIARKVAVAREEREEIDMTDDGEFAAELRHERAMAAAASVPTRNQRSTDRRRPTAKPSGRPSGRRHH